MGYLEIEASKIVRYNQGKLYRTLEIVGQLLADAQRDMYMLEAYKEKGFDVGTDPSACLDATRKLMEQLDGLKKMLGDTY